MPKLSFLQKFLIPRIVFLSQGPKYFPLLQTLNNDIRCEHKIVSPYSSRFLIRGSPRILLRLGFHAQFPVPYLAFILAVIRPDTV